MKKYILVLKQNFSKVNDIACAEWEKNCGNKVRNSMSIRDRLRKKEQIVKEREANRVHQAKQKDIGVR